MLSFFINYGCNQNIPGNPSKKWRIPFALQMIPGVILFFGLLTQNESPRWLVEKARTDDALRALAHIRAKSEDDPSVQRELEEIIVDFRNQERLTLPQQIKSAISSRSYLYRVGMAITLMLYVLYITIPLLSSSQTNKTKASNNGRARIR
jgi:MFS transporter, SP family, sugar:H+ symporter